MNPDNITIIQDIFGGFDIAVQVERTHEVMEQVTAVSDFIATLPLTRQQNDRLVELLTDMVNTLEHDLFLKGAVFGRCWLVPADRQEDSA